MRWNQYLFSYAYKFVGDIKQQMFYQLWNFKLDTLIINHFIIEHNWYGIVTRRSLPGIPRRSTTSLFFKLPFDIFLTGYTEVKYQLKLSFYHEYQIWRIIEWNRQYFTKKESLPKPCQHNTLKEFSFPYIHATPR